MESYTIFFDNILYNINNTKCLCRKNKLHNVHEQCNRKIKQDGFCGTHLNGKDKLLATKPLPDKYKKMIIFSKYLEKEEKVFRKCTILELLNTLRYYRWNTSGKLKKEEMIQYIESKFKTLKYFSLKEKLDKIIKIQKIIKQYQKKKEIILRGPGFNNRKACNNQEDFLTFELVEDIPNKYFFSFKDSDNFIYGFDIRSFGKLIDNKMNNPYNRSDIPIQAITYLKKLLNNPKYNLEEIKLAETSKDQKMRHRVLSVFQKIDQLDTYAGGTNINWFLNLSKNQLKLYYKVLEDIWNYRSELSPCRKNEIVPNKKMFPIRVSFFYNLTEKNKMRKILLQEMDKMIDSAEKREDRILGSYYVLIGLVETSQEVANSLPWLVQV